MATPVRSNKHSTALQTSEQAKCVERWGERQRQLQQAEYIANIYTHIACIMYTYIYSVSRDESAVTATNKTISERSQRNPTVHIMVYVTCSYGKLYSGNYIPRARVSNQIIAACVVDVQVCVRVCVIKPTVLWLAERCYAKCRVRIFTTSE